MALFTKVTLEQWIADTKDLLGTRQATIAYDNIKLPVQEDSKAYNIYAPYDICTKFGTTLGKYDPITVYTGLIVNLTADELLQLTINPDSATYVKYGFVSSEPMLTRPDTAGKHLKFDIVSNELKTKTIGRGSTVVQAILLSADGSSSGGEGTHITASINGGDPVSPDANDNINLVVNIPEQVSVSVNGGTPVDPDENGVINLTISTGGSSGGESGGGSSGGGSSTPANITVSVNNGTPVTPDANGNINLTIKNQTLSIKLGGTDAVAPSDSTGVATLNTDGIMLYRSFSTEADFTAAVASTAGVSKNTLCNVGASWYLMTSATTYLEIPLVPITSEEINSLTSSSSDDESSE
jgi:hypothetical protein